MKKKDAKPKKFWWCLVDQKEKHHIIPDHVFQAWKNEPRFVKTYGPWYQAGYTAAYNALIRELHPELC